MSEQLDMGRFQGMVLERLDNLQKAADRVEICLVKHHDRLTVLEHLATRAKVWGTVIGVVAGFVGSKLSALIGMKPGVMGLVGGSALLFWPFQWPFLAPVVPGVSVLHGWTTKDSAPTGEVGTEQGRTKPSRLEPSEA